MSYLVTFDKDKIRYDEIVFCFKKLYRGVQSFFNEGRGFRRNS